MPVSRRVVTLMARVPGLSPSGPCAPPPRQQGALFQPQALTGLSRWAGGVVLLGEWAEPSAKAILGPRCTDLPGSDHSLGLEGRALGESLAGDLLSVGCLWAV